LVSIDLGQQPQVEISKFVSMCGCMFIETMHRVKLCHNAKQKIHENNSISMFQKIKNIEAKKSTFCTGSKAKNKL
jgi:hypothetical protein